MRTLEEIKGEQRALKEAYARLAKDADQIRAQQLRETLPSDWTDLILAAAEKALESAAANFGRGSERITLKNRISVGVSVEVLSASPP